MRCLRARDSSWSCSMAGQAMSRAMRAGRAVGKRKTPATRTTSHHGLVCLTFLAHTMSDINSESLSGG